MPKTACFTRTDTLRFCQNYQLIWVMWVYGYIVDVATSLDGLRWTRVAHNARNYAFTTPPKRTIHRAPFVVHEPHCWWIFTGTGSGRYFLGWVVERDDQDNIGFDLWPPRGNTHDISGQIIEIEDE